MSNSHSERKAYTYQVLAEHWDCSVDLIYKWYAAGRSRLFALAAQRASAR